MHRFDAGTGHTKNEMEIGTENCNFTVWKMAEKRLLNGTLI